MNDEIKTGFIFWLKNKGSFFKDEPEVLELYKPEIFEAYKAGSASRDDEVGELVEILKDIFTTRPQATGTTGVVNEENAVAVLNLYKKTPCPECCPGGVVETREARPEDYICDCGACHGRGYRWERK